MTGHHRGNDLLCLPQGTRELIVRMYRDGEPVADIMNMARISTTVLYRILREDCVPRRGRLEMIKRVHQKMQAPS